MLFFKKKKQVVADHVVDHGSVENAISFLDSVCRMDVGDIVYFFHRRDGKKCKGYVVEPPVNEAAYRASVIVLNSNGILGDFMYICIRDIIRVEQRNVKTRGIL